jgi:hypothetical protein
MERPAAPGSAVTLTEPLRYRDPQPRMSGARQRRIPEQAALRARLMPPAATVPQSARARRQAHRAPFPASA